jgi:hypothetical protein
MGTVSESWWGRSIFGRGGFAKATTAEWGGEIAFSHRHYCTPMGDDFYGKLQNSASVTHMFFEKPNQGLFAAKAHLNRPTDTRYWDSNRKPGKVTFSAFRYGGPYGGPNGC